MSRRTKPAPEIPGLTASRVFEATWLGREGRSWSYHRPDDCRSHSRRINVHMWKDGKGSEVRAIEGDGRTDDFIRHEIVVLPDGAGDEEAAAAARKLAETYLSSKSVGISDNERLITGALLSAGFLLDDYYSGEAWLKPADMEGFTWYVRGEAEVHFPVVHGSETPVCIPGDLHPDMPCEVGLASQNDEGRTYVVVPSLDEAIRVATEAVLPYPSVDEIRVFAPEDLFPGPKI